MISDRDSPVNVPRWFTEKDEEHSSWYAEHFRELASEGADLSGEARLVDAIVAPGSRILDAGCGQGRTAAALHLRGHSVTAVDIDPVLLDAAKLDSPGPAYVEGDLVSLDLSTTFDAAVSAGNVITFVAEGTEETVLRNIRTHLAIDAPYLLGFHVDRYPLEDFDRDLRQAGFTLESRFATWDLRPFTSDSDFAVSVLRNS